MNGTSTALIVVGLFFLGGIYSFAKQQMPKGLIVLLSIGAAMCLFAGVLRLRCGIDRHRQAGRRLRLRLRQRPLRRACPRARGSRRRDHR
ncbi:hypothetical protein LV779_33635 [Streptomyces thinghirensis]|nr:hypothetical protein [Streptomyces thinghirensis]